LRKRRIIAAHLGSERRQVHLGPGDGAETRAPCFFGGSGAWSHGYSRNWTVFGALRHLFPSRHSSTAAPKVDAAGNLLFRKELEMPIGTVKFFNADKGYGFIQPDGGGQDAFVHISAVEKAGMRTLDRDQRVSYELETDNRGKTSACNLAAA
jgi:CspA family cold shock protein